MACIVTVSPLHMAYARAHHALVVWYITRTRLVSSDGLWFRVVLSLSRSALVRSLFALICPARALLLRHSLQ